ncbi:MAG: hypothetical protein JWN18_757 [Parcubacteria group bacterium]|nr:hypothetical protein [Parcubacteria group bacterium]
MTTETWISDLPRSRMVYPTNVLDQLKYWIWRVYTPIHPAVRNLSTLLGLDASVFSPIDDSGRQDYLFGILHPDRPLRDFVDHLVSHGFGNHFVAWKDSGEVISLRKPLDFRFQYHIRVFHDGEVRCHYEYTPEYRPLQHLTQIGFEDRRSEFELFLRDWIIPV